MLLLLSLISVESVIGKGGSILSLRGRTANSKDVVNEGLWNRAAYLQCYTDPQLTNRWVDQRLATTDV